LLDGCPLGLGPREQVDGIVTAGYGVVVPKRQKV
jgi:hypothetical protein